VYLFIRVCGVPAVISSVSDRDASASHELERLGLLLETSVRVEAGIRRACRWSCFWQEIVADFCIP
jgi:hypothetical protein